MPRYKIKLTVTKKLSGADVFGQPLEDINMTPVCDRLEEGQIFEVDEAGTMPLGFCPWAWHDIYPEVTTLRVGGSFPWMKTEGKIYACCTDGARPVFFTLERIQG